MSAFPLEIMACGAVTPLGLTAAQTCAAIRAGITVFSEVYQGAPSQEPVIGARIPASQRLRRTAHDWLLHLAVRAIDECLDRGASQNRTALILILPEAFRGHPAMSALRDENEIRRRLEKQLGVRFCNEFMVLQDGRAGVQRALTQAAEWLSSGCVEACIVGGVDTLITSTDINRLQQSYRLYDKNNPQGVIPGEGAAFLRVTSSDKARPGMARVLACGIAQEKNTILGERYSQGDALRLAIESAFRRSGIPEKSISFRVSDMNGERYHAWESILAESRSYRTRRESFPAWYLASSVGDMGVAAGVLTVIVAAVGIKKNYAPGAISMCEASSDEGLRGACVIAPSPGNNLGTSIRQ